MENAVSQTKFIRVMGVPRAGNHPIIKFITQNAGPRGYAHFNYCRPKIDPLDAPSVETVEGMGKLSDAEREQIRARIDGNHFDLVVFSYEDLFLAAHHALDNRISEPFEDRIQYNLFITRSFPNWLASWLQQRLRKLDKNPDSPFNLETNPFHVCEKSLRVFQNWLVHLRAVDDAIRNRGMSQSFGVTNVGAVFDTFTHDPGHRAQILQDLGMGASNLDMPGVTNYGGGSSFSGLKITESTDLKVEERWRHFRDNPYFIGLMQIFWANPEVRELTCRYFPDSAASMDELLAGGF